MAGRLRKAWFALREYANLFVDGEAEFEDYILAVLLMAYAFILLFMAVPI